MPIGPGPATGTLRALRSSQRPIPRIEIATLAESGRLQTPGTPKSTSRERPCRGKEVSRSRVPRFAFDIDGRGHGWYQGRQKFTTGPLEDQSLLWMASDAEAQLLHALAPDIAVDQERGKAFDEGDQCPWFGDNPKMGVAVQAFGRYRLRALPALADAPKHIVPVDPATPIRKRRSAERTLPIELIRQGGATRPARAKTC